MMEEFFPLFLNALAPSQAAFLMASSFFCSMLTASLGIGGGVLLLALMANVMPPLALIPVHGVVQLGSNFFRAALMVKHVWWKPFAAFLAGAVTGVLIGGSIAVNLPPALLMVGVGLFVLWSVLARPPKWLTRWPALTGLVSSFLTMFFGATGPFVASYTRALDLKRQQYVATNAVFMTLQHVLKTLAFGTLGFAFGPWAGFILAMIACGFMGTLVGRALLERLSDHNFKRILDAALVLIAARLIWVGIRGLL